MTPLAASTFVWVFILIPLLVVWAIGVVDIVRRSMSGKAKAAWGSKPTQEELRRHRAAPTDADRVERGGGFGPRPPVD
jgi:hypothetical protein